MNQKEKLVEATMKLILEDNNTDLSSILKPENLEKLQRYTPTIQDKIDTGNYSNIVLQYFCKIVNMKISDKYYIDGVGILEELTKNENKLNSISDTRFDMIEKFRESTIGTNGTMSYYHFIKILISNVPDEGIKLCIDYLYANDYYKNNPVWPNGTDFWGTEYDNLYLLVDDRQFCYWITDNSRLTICSTLLKAGYTPRALRYLSIGITEKNTIKLTDQVVKFLLNVIKKDNVRDVDIAYRLYEGTLDIETLSKLYSKPKFSELLSMDDSLYTDFSYSGYGMEGNRKVDKDIPLQIINLLDELSCNSPYVIKQLYCQAIKLYTCGSDIDAIRNMLSKFNGINTESINSDSDNTMMLIRLQRSLELLNNIANYAGLSVEELKIIGYRKEYLDILKPGSDLKDCSKEIWDMHNSVNCFIDAVEFLNDCITKDYKKVDKNLMKYLVSQKLYTYQIDAIIQIHDKIGMNKNVLDILTNDDINSKQASVIVRAICIDKLPVKEVMEFMDPNIAASNMDAYRRQLKKKLSGK